MSTTKDQQIAFDFSGGANTPGTIFSISFTGASRGADIKLVSVWPEEEELLFCPFTYITCKNHMQVGGKRYIQVDATVSTVRVRLDCLDLTDCTSVPQHGAGTAPPAAPQRLRVTAKGGSE